MRISSIGALSICMFLAGMAFAEPTHAYQTRVISQVNQGTNISITDPEIKTTWYDELRGSPRVYEIESATAFRFVANLSVPDRESPRQDYIVEIIELSGSAATPDRVFATFDGSGADWDRTYNWIDGRWYLTGLSIDEDVPPGRYRVTVGNSINRGKYIFSVGYTIDPSQAYAPLRTVVDLTRVATYHGDTLASVLRGPFVWALVAVLLMFALLLGRIFRYLMRDRQVR